MAGKKESALELAKLMDKNVRVKLAGGREGAGWRAPETYAPIVRRDAGKGCWAAGLRAPWVSPGSILTPAVSGVLKGYDQLLNLVLDEAIEYLRGRPPFLPLSSISRHPGGGAGGVIAARQTRSRGVSFQAPPAGAPDPGADGGARALQTLKTPCASRSKRGTSG
jgi:hypothetical protein